MKLIVDIPDDMWAKVKDGYVPLGIGKHLQNGTPLSVLLADIRGELWMEGMNMGGEYQGVWVRYRDIERVIDKHISGGEE